MEEIKLKIQIIRNNVLEDLPKGEKIFAHALIDIAEIFLLDLHRLANK